MLFIITKSVHYLGINVIKYVQESYKTWVKGMKNLTKWWNISSSWVENLEVVKIYILLKVIHAFIILIKISKWRML